MRSGKDDWSFRLGYVADIDFCVWVLERDGLQVTPFDRHPDGDGSLRAAGLDAATWRAWLGRVVAGLDERDKLLDHRPRDWAGIDALRPEALWDWSPRIGAELAALAETYRSSFSDRKRVSTGVRPLPWESNDRELWQALLPYHGRITPMRVVLVAYPGPTRAVVTPATVILGTAGWHPSREEFDAAVVAGAEELATDERRNQLE